ncbi:DNA cytosine methyltransferase [Malacoplasma muris]|uniref:DNA cytosine methyltransferase n=1 Tax=Malacoplasma muris TaxID=2119 RepID=UPI00398E83F6
MIGEVDKTTVLSTFSDNKINIIDLFAGIGGFHYAFKNTIKDTNIEYNCSLVSEIDTSAIHVYRNNFNYENDIIDVNKINDHLSKDENVKENVDIVFCGFPCQSFSNAGMRKGFQDENRGKLIFKVIGFVKQYKPKIILLENVKHIVKHDNGRTFKIIIDEFKKLEYITTKDVLKDPLILNPINFNLYQSRERVFIPFVKKDIAKNVNDLGEPKQINNTFEKIKWDKKIIFDDKVDNKYYLKSKKNCSETYRALKAWEEFVKYFISKKKKIPVIWLDEMINKKYKSKSIAINSDWYKNYMNAMNKFYKENKTFIDKWAKKHKVLDFKLRRNKKLEWQAGMDTKFEETYLQLRQSGFRFRKPICFPTLVATVQVPIIHDKKGWRYLTPKENAKLQSFPEEHIIDKNDHQAYKQYGNSINVNVARLVIETFLLKYIKEIYERKRNA